MQLCVVLVVLYHTCGYGFLGYFPGQFGFTYACVLVPTVNSATITPHAESFQAVVWHLLVSRPALRAAEMKWSRHADAPRCVSRS